jgi:hypothetical protein
VVGGAGIRDALPGPAAWVLLAAAAAGLLVGIVWVHVAAAPGSQVIPSPVASSTAPDTSTASVAPVDQGATGENGSGPASTSAAGPSSSTSPTGRHGTRPRGGAGLATGFSRGSVSATPTPTVTAGEQASVTSSPPPPAGGSPTTSPADAEATGSPAPVG